MLETEEPIHEALDQLFPSLAAVEPDWDAVSRDASRRPRPARPARTHLPRKRTFALALPAAALIAAAAVLALGTGSASGTPALPEPLPFGRGLHHQAVALLESAAALQSRTATSSAPVTYAKTQSYALQTDVGRGSSTSYVETTVREVWAAQDGSALAKSWRQDTTRAGTPVGGPTSVTDDPDWQDTNRDLPSSAAAVEAQLFRAGAAARSATQQMTLAANVMSHLSDGTTTAAQVSGLYSVLSRLPGVFDAGTVTDNAGRSGRAIGIVTGTFDAGRKCLPTNGELSQTQMNTLLAQHGALGHGVTYLVLDPATGQPLQVEEVDLPNAPCGLDLPASPTIEQYSVILAAGQVAATGATPRR